MTTKAVLNYAEYAQRVADKLELRTIEKLEAVYGDLIMDCYTMEDTVDQCCFYCHFDGDEQVEQDDEQIN